MTYELYDSFIETFKLPEDEQLKGIKVIIVKKSVICALIFLFGEPPN